jgi:hypothetical protein
MDYSSWYEKKYPFLSGHGLWLRGNELNTLPPERFSSSVLPVLISRLSTYRDVAGSLTHKLLYQIVSRVDGIFPDLAYLPPPKDSLIMDRDCIPWLIGTSTKKEAIDFSIIAFSLSIVQEILNIRLMLEKSNIPSGKKERMKNEKIPLVILGGASSLYTSSIFCSDPIVDGIFVGSDPACISKIFEICLDARQRGFTKKTTLNRLYDVPGFFEPDGKIETRVYKSSLLPEEQLLENGIIFYDEEQIGRGTLQISEGCACLCSFCAEGFSHRPYREFDEDKLVNAAMNIKRFMAADKIDLFSFNFAMYRNFYGLVKDLTEHFTSVGLKSQRLDSIAQDSTLLDVLHCIGKSSMTCAMEGISARMRNYLNKSLSEHDLKKALFALMSARLRELKIFLIATGLEQEEDFEEFRKLLSYIQTLLVTSGSRPRIIFSMTILVRFPFTPLELEDAIPPGICDRVLFRTGKLVRGASFEFRSSASPADYFISQLLVRACSPEILHIVENVRKETGFIYYKEIPDSLISAVKDRLANSGLDMSAILNGRNLDDRACVPWRGIDIGIDNDFMRRQWKAATTFMDTGHCAGTTVCKGECRGCKACGDESAINRIALQPETRKYAIASLAESIKAARVREIPLYISVKAGDYFRGLPRKLRAAAVARAMMITDERIVRAYRGINVDCSGIQASDWVIGHDSFIIYWDGRFMDLLDHACSHVGFIGKVNEILGGIETVLCFNKTALVECLVYKCRSRFQLVLSDFCRNRSLKYTTVKTDSGMRCVFSKESLKKKILIDCYYVKDEHGIYSLNIIPGHRFNIEDFMQTAFLFDEKEDWVRIEVEADIKI